MSIQLSLSNEGGRDSTTTEDQEQTFPGMTASIKKMKPKKAKKESKEETKKEQVEKEKRKDISNIYHFRQELYFS